MTTEDDKGIAIYKVSCSTILPTYFPDLQLCNSENDVAMTQMKRL
jgi:hypothetical protein